MQTADTFEISTPDESIDLLIEQVGGIEVLMPIDNVDNLSPEELRERQLANSKAIEEVFTWCQKDNGYADLGLESESTLKDLIGSIKSNIIDAVNTGKNDVNLLATESSKTNPTLSLKHLLDVRSGIEGELTAGQVRELRNVLSIIFDPEDTNVLTLNYEELDKYREEQDNNEDLKVALKVSGAFIQAYVNIITSALDDNKIQLFGEYVQNRLLNSFEAGEFKERPLAAVFGFGDVASGKGTAGENLGIEMLTFITGTGGVSKPGKGYEHLFLTTRGLAPLIDAEGFPSFMDVIALPSILGFRHKMDKGGLSHIPIYFDGYPRTPTQAQRIMNKLPAEKVRAYYLRVEPETALSRTLNRLVMTVLNQGELRGDDLNSLIVNTPEGNRKLNTDLIKGLVTFYKQSVENEGDMFLYADRITDKIKQFFNSQIGSIAVDDKSRYVKYHNDFPKILKDLSKMFGIKVPVISVDHLSREEVPIHIINSIGPEAFQADNSFIKKRSAEVIKNIRRVTNLVRNAYSHGAKLHAVSSIQGGISKFIGENVERFAHYQDLNEGERIVDNSIGGTIFINESIDPIAIVGVERVKGELIPLINIPGKGLRKMSDLDPNIRVRVTMNGKYEAQSAVNAKTVRDITVLES